MNTEILQPENGMRIEPLHLLDRHEPVWMILTLHAGIITRIELVLEKPDSPASKPLAAPVLKRILLGRDADRRGLKFQAAGTPFQKAVWSETCRIPSGRLAAYGTIARRISCGSPRAVGQALRKNPLPIIIPCHRVIGWDGRLTGFSGGVEIKKMLIEFESENKEKRS